MSEGTRNFEWGRFRSDVWSAANVGDAIAGTVVGIEVRDGRSGPVPVVTLELADGSTRQVWGGAVDLRQQLADVAPQVGSYLRIVFTGERHTGQPSAYRARPSSIDSPSWFASEASQASTSPSSWS